MAELKQWEVGKTYMFKDEKAKESWFHNHDVNPNIYKKYYQKGFTVVGLNAIHAIHAILNEEDNDSQLDDDELKFFKLKPDTSEEIISSENEPTSTQHKRIEELQAGDGVFDLRFGWGVVSGVEFDGYYPMRVTFLKGNQHYTLEGFFDVTMDKYPSLYTYDPIHNTKPEIKREIDWSKVPMGTKVKCGSNLKDYEGAWLFLSETKGEFPFLVLNHTKNMTARSDNCELDCEVQEEWYK